MKKLLIVTIAIASSTAFASRARMTALGNAAHLIDTQTVMSNPADMMFMDDYVNFESGVVSQDACYTAELIAMPNGDLANCANLNAEGTIVRSYGDSKIGLTLGHQSKNASIWGLRGLASKFTAYANFLTLKDQQNPVEIHYGTKLNDFMVGATLVYSNYNDKAAEVKESTAGLRFGARNDVWDAKVGLGLINTFEDGAADEKFKGTAGYSVAVGYKMDDLYFNGGISLVGFKTEIGGADAAKFDATEITLTAIKNNKLESGNFFYGVTLNSTTAKEKENDLTDKKSLTLPLFVGFETEANSWLTLRASLEQTSIINNSKDEGVALPSEYAPAENSTVAAVGAGLKFNKLAVDGTLKGLTGGTASQDVNGSNLLAQVGFTYTF